MATAGAQLHIAVVATSYPRDEEDPAGHFVRASVRALEREGHRVTVVAPSPGGAFGWPGVAARIREQPLRAVGAAAWVARARAAITAMPVDRVIAHWALPCAWPIGVVAKGELQVVSHGGDVRLLRRVPGIARRRAVDAIASRATTWCFASQGLLEEFLGSLHGPTRSRVEGIALVEPPPLEMPDVRDAIALRRGELGAARVAVSVGRLVAGKRVDRAIAHFRARPDLDVLYVVGDGPERTRLEALADSAGKRVQFIGALPRRETLAWIGAADLLIHASEAEGLSTVLREAEALGTPAAWLGGAGRGHSRRPSFARRRRVAR
jgi:glycosyltransferase involved in cell wall biosynthesis